MERKSTLRCAQGRGNSGFAKMLTMLAMMLFVVTGAWAQNQWTSNGCTVTLNNGVLTISKSTTGSGAMANYTTTNNNRAPWYNRRNSITSVVVESGVTSIGNYAFNGCTGITTINLPSSVTIIGNSAFNGCSNLAEVTIQATSLTTYGINAFNNTSSNLVIYVPAASVNTYKNANNWRTTYASKIKAIPTYSVTLAEGTEDADNWVINPTEAAEGQTVTLTYSGEREVKSITAVKTIPTLATAFTNGAVVKVVAHYQGNSTGDGWIEGTYDGTSFGNTSSDTSIFNVITMANNNGKLVVVFTRRTNVSKTFTFDPDNNSYTQNGSNNIIFTSISVNGTDIKLTAN